MNWGFFYDYKLILHWISSWTHDFPIYFYLGNYLSINVYSIVCVYMRLVYEFMSLILSYGGELLIIDYMRSMT